MAVITTEKLGATVGAQVHGRGPRAPARRRRRSPQWTPGRARGERRPGVPGPPRRRRDAGGVQQEARDRSRSFRLVASRPRSSASPSIPAKNPAAAYLRGTFDWHIDGVHRRHPDHGHGAERPRRRRVRRRDRVRQHVRRLRRRSPTTRRRTLETVRVVHTIEASQRLHNPDPSPRGGRRCGASGRPRSTRWCGRHRSGRRSLVLGATTDHVVGMDRRGGACAARRPPRPLDRARPGLPPPSGTVGDMVIWDNRGVLHRACPYDRPTRPRDMHRTTIAGNEAIQ